jgi:hypothetical protein
MSKAILVMDMPNSCDVCDFNDERYHYCNIIWFGKDVSDYVACRHEDCPLREVPQKKEEKVYTSMFAIAKKNGWNDCIDAILKEGAE